MKAQAVNEREQTLDDHLGEVAFFDLAKALRLKDEVDHSLVQDRRFRPLDLRHLLARERPRPVADLKPGFELPFLVDRQIVQNQRPESLQACKTTNFLF